MFTTPRAFYPTYSVENELTAPQLRHYKLKQEQLKQHFPWSDALKPVWNACLIHLSARVPGKVAYFASPENLMKDRLTRTSPEMFLERVLKYAPDEVRGAWEAEVLNRTLPTIEFIPNTDPDGWESVYAHGPHSCMQWSSLVRCYANPKNNLALAYWKENNVIIHRTIVNTERLTYLRAYGHTNMPYFLAALRQLGYTQSSNTLEGETITIEWEDCYQCGISVMRGPYLDGGFTCIKPTSVNNTIGIIGIEGPEPDYGETAYCGCERDDDDEDYYDAED